MKGWIISVVCVIVLGVLLEIVLPKGKISKYVKGTFSLVVILVIVSPLPKLFGKEWNLNFEAAWAKANGGFVSETKDARMNEKEIEIENYLLLYGFDCEVSLTGGKGILDFDTAEVVDYGKSEDAENVIKLVSTRLNIAKNKIKFILKPPRESGE